jgi:predicted PurR-regulated permease PerM
MTDERPPGPDRDDPLDVDDRVVRLRFTTASIVGGVAVFGVMLVLIAVADRAIRPLSWLLVAVIVAALLEPAVGFVARYVPRALAIVAVMLTSMVLFAGLGFLLADDLRLQYDRLERQLPDAARELEDSSSFGEFAQSFDLTERVTTFVDDLPGELAGGTAVDALQSAADRGAVFLVTAILSLFMLVYGRKFVASGLDQITDSGRRDRVGALLRSSYGRSWRYLALTTIKAVAAGAFTTLLCWFVGVDAPVILGIWVGLWSFVPALGIVVGSIPVLLVSVLDGFGIAPVLLAVFLAYQVFDVLVVQPQITARSLRVGPALTILVGVVGLELYGVGGLIVGVILLVFGVAVADALAPDDAGELNDGVKRVFDGTAGPDVPDTMRPA